MSLRTTLVILACAALYLLGNAAVPLWDRDEPRYAQASRQMLDSGDWVLPKLLDEPRINKPPLIYWTQASSMWVTRKLCPITDPSPVQQMQRDAFAARLPSAIAMTFTLAMMAIVLRRLLDEQRAFWTVLIMGTSGLVIMAAKMCLTDAVLLLFVTASQWCLYAFYRRRGTWPIVITFAVTTALGLLTKGPVVLGVNATTLLILFIMRWLTPSPARANEDTSPATASRVGEGRGEGPTSVAVLSLLAKLLLALAIILAIGLPWVIAMQQRLPGGLEATFKHDVLKRMAQPLEQHKGPPGYYLVFFFASFFPWCLLMPTALKYAWKNRASPLLRFSLAAVVGPWIMFEIFQTKLPHYVLPCFPFLALLTADALIRCARGEYDDLVRRAAVIAAGVWGAFVIALGAGPWVAALPWFSFDNLPYFAMTIVTVAAIGFAIIVFIAFARRRILPAAAWMAATIFGLFVLLFALYLPRAPFLHLSEQVGGYLQSIGVNQPGQSIAIDYKEDSLFFYQGGTIRPQRKDAFLKSTPPQEWPPYIVLTRKIWDDTPPEIQQQLEVLKTFKGWAYANKGRVMDVMVVRAKASE